MKWSEEIEGFSRAALAPADISNIMLDNENNSMDVIVEEDQLSLAVGRRGQNVRLAAMLTGLRINILSKSKLQEKFKKATENLLQVEGITEAWSQVLVQEGIMSVGDISGLKAQDLVELLGIGKVKLKQF